MSELADLFAHIYALDLDELDEMIEEVNRIFAERIRNVSETLVRNETVIKLHGRQR